MILLPLAVTTVAVLLSPAAAVARTAPHPPSWSATLPWPASRVGLSRSPAAVTALFGQDVPASDGSTSQFLAVAASDASTSPKVAFEASVAPEEGYAPFVLGVAGAGHLEAADPGLQYNLSAGSVDAVAVLGEDYGTLSRCTVAAYVSTAGGKAAWSKIMPECATPAMQPGGLSPSVISDDGSRVLVGAYVSGAWSLIALNASTGAHLGTYVASGVPASSMLLGVSSQREGAIAAVTLGQDVHVVNTTAGSLYGGSSVIHMGTGVRTAATLCPMGVFLVYGSAEAYVHRWDPSAKTYGQIWHTNLTKTAGNGIWNYGLSATSVNGEDKNVAGCIVGIAWSRSSRAGVRVDVYSMLTKQHFIGWESAASSQSTPAQITSIVMHMDYTAVTISGLDSMSLAVFTITSPGAPVITFGGQADLAAAAMFWAPPANALAFSSQASLFVAAVGTSSANRSSGVALYYAVPVDASAQAE